MTQYVYIKTFGCRTNVFDSQVMVESLRNYTITNDLSQANAVVVNSCTVTNSADSSVRAFINQANKIAPQAKVYLTGCGAHTKGAALLEANKVFGVFGQSHKEDIDGFLNTSKPFFEPGDLSFVDQNIVTQFVGKERAFIKIQEGCNFRCNYCIIPFVRGDARDMPQAKILEQVRQLAQNKYSEFVLTGTNMGSFGNKHEGTSLAKLLEAMGAIPGVKRIRLGSMEPIQITDEFKALLDAPFMARHLHIAIQHTHDEMLRTMNRRNRVKSDSKLLEELAQKGYALGTDFIVGHPGESDVVWSEAQKAFRDLPLTHLHAFTYSKRDNTPSALMTHNTVSGDIAKERLAVLQDIVAQNNYQFRQNNSNNVLNILVESQKNGYFFGLDDYFNEVFIQSRQALEGKWVQLQQYEVKKEANYGSI